MYLRIHPDARPMTGNSPSTGDKTLLLRSHRQKLSQLLFFFPLMISRSESGALLMKQRTYWRAVCRLPRH